MLRFCYRLGLQVGELDPVQNIYGRLTRRQICTWMAFLQLEPLTADRLEHLSAFQNAMLFNRRLREGETPLEVSDLLIDREQQRLPDDDISTEIQREEAMVAGILSHFG